MAPAVAEERVDVGGLPLLGRLLLVVAVGAWLFTLAALISDRTAFAPDRARSPQPRADGR
ncbi:hypothetical protein IU433_00485 [Nocardia puris]|uniref:Uncharacterized protein n=1 Tax=Nocardia puris TaxID=208602 RepID=A0A366DUB0_9NOCA|nr:hypothetical protein [Nocardia puris]MBF6210263.1 hypothetical protein [Nocardia puris]MBF6367339.1 hypothetical protein [Nocardia puris]MBF6457524.1 hypothetical protein [Nocardia puris]RBO93681.1 hypothetical protein DFR74_10298 [Nocardia puris]